MITVSDAYKSAVYATSRMVKPKLVFTFVDVSAKADASITASSELSLSKKAQVVDELRTTSSKLATFENNLWKLDGSFSLYPLAAETGYQVGWWSNVLSQADGTFSTPPTLTTTFASNHSSIGLTITFDEMSGEYASDFSITFKDSGGSTIYATSVTNNTSAVYILTQNVSNYRSVVISVSKWAGGYRRARIVELDFGIIYTYTESELVSLDVVEELDPTSNNSTSNELKFTLDNSAKLFNILSPTSVYAYLQRMQKLNPYLGVVKDSGSIEYIPLGVYYLTDWNSDQGSLTASFTARDLIDTLDQVPYPQTAYTSKTLKFIIDAIMTVAGVTNYVVDSALSSITVTGTLPSSSARQALQTCIVAGQAVMYCDRVGTIQIKQLTATTAVDMIDFDNIYSAPAINLDKLINTVSVTYGANTYTLVDPSKPANETTSSVKIDNPLISALAHAQNVASWALAELKKRYLYDIDWRQNPALESGDIVTVEDDFSANKTARITKQEFNFKGYLSGKTYGRGDGT